MEGGNPGEMCRGWELGAGKGWPRVSSIGGGVNKTSVSRRFWAGAATGCLRTFAPHPWMAEREAVSTLACSAGWGGVELEWGGLARRFGAPHPTPPAGPPPPFFSPFSF